mmetsp:Transcript_165280/g.530509  ORF Transcript_165280/g.530509 Transcript_165280/m.530509 type:complete len:299 (-) Transcript_165280:65-961(-)
MIVDSLPLQNSYLRKAHSRACARMMHLEPSIVCQLLWQACRSQLEIPPEMCRMSTRRSMVRSASREMLANFSLQKFLCCMMPEFRRPLRVLVILLRLPLLLLLLLSPCRCRQRHHGRQRRGCTQRAHMHNSRPKQRHCRSYLHRRRPCHKQQCLNRFHKKSMVSLPQQPFMRPVLLWLRLLKLLLLMLLPWVPRLLMLMLLLILLLLRLLRVLVVSDRSCRTSRRLQIPTEAALSSSQLRQLRIHSGAGRSTSPSRQMLIRLAAGPSNNQFRLAAILSVLLDDIPLVHLVVVHTEKLC